MMVLGLDAGGARVGACVLDVRPGIPARWLAAQVFDVGHSVERAKPKVSKAGRVQLGQHVIDVSDLRRLRAALEDFRRATCPRFDRVLVEAPNGGAARLRAREVSQAAMIAGVLIGWALEGHVSETAGLVSAREVRAWLATLGGGVVSNADVKARLVVEVPSMPRRTSADERDACAAALYGGRR